ncbi:unnamed protein product [Schistosoma mattheei]|uniref:Uncharacterized protein n=1 Tax=Schistosoma mattheei TaxID=31246 RepID=A0AA85B9H4_9TREM|nr:unnamed protein product [Schistosoma mattheei]
MNEFSVLYDDVCQRVSRSLMEALKPFDGIDTVATHGGYNPVYLEEVGRPVVPPITLSSTFQQLSPGVAKYDYSRSGNFSRECLEKCIASLEDGHDCCVFSSGLAALGTLIQVLSSDDHIVAFDDLYGGNGRYLRRLASKSGITTTFVDMRDLNLFQQALQKNTRLVLIESPSNPLMRLVDISAVASIAHEFNKEIIVVVDNTFMSSYFQRPLDHGANVVLHSLTKYMNGLGKFGFYEVFKHIYNGFLSEENAYLWRTSVYLAASASAEFFADIMLCPMEAVKVRIQTMPGWASTLREGVPKMYRNEGLVGFYKGLPPLWGRQIPYTMMKFACFERTVEALYKHVVPKPREKCSKSEQLVVTFAAGYIAGVFCAIVSHPPDTIVSKLNKDPNARLVEVAKNLGLMGMWSGLGPRIIMIGTLTALQWFIYDGFKVAMQLPRPPPPSMPESLKNGFNVV